MKGDGHVSGRRAEDVPSKSAEGAYPNAVNPVVHKHSWEGLYCPEDGVGSSERLRELEAELELKRIPPNDLSALALVRQYKARAEKAEKELVAEKKEADKVMVKLWKAEARVAELETDIKVLELIGESQGAGPRRAAEIEMELAKIEAARKSKGAP